MNNGSSQAWQSSGVRRVKQIVGLGLLYTTLLSLSFVFLYPILYFVSQSFMRAEDIIDATVQWIPKGLSLEHFAYSFTELHYWQRFYNSVIIALGSAFVQIIGCSIAGYGFARFRFPGYKLCLGLVLFTFLVPPQSYTVPLFLFFSDLKWTNTFLPFLVPGIFGHGLRGALFVLVFTQFFRGLPKQLEESAKMDGAGSIRTFRSIMLPLALPAILVVFLFSIVWNWNDTFLPNLYINNGDLYTVNQALATLDVVHTRGEMSEVERDMTAIGQPPTNSQKIMAGALLSILPILILYLFTQRYFVEGVERTGLAGD